MATPPVPPPPVPNPNKPVVLAAPPTGGAASAGSMAIVPGAAGAQVQNQATVDEVQGEENGIERSFWQLPFVQDIMPFVTSILLHVGIVAIGLLSVKTYQLIQEISKVPVIIPDATIIDGAQVGGIPHPGLGGDPTRDAAQDKFKEVPDTSTGIADKPSTSLTQALTGGGAGESDDTSIAVGASSGSFGKGTGVGAGSGSGVGQGTGDGGALAKFGKPGGGGGIGPKSPFMGVSGNAMKVVYLCDATGTMMNLFDSLRFELRKAIDVLKPVQSFNILFFQDDTFLILDKASLVLATPEMKRKAHDFLESSSAHGTTNPLPAIRAAFAQQPQLIYVLTDGFDAVSSYKEVVDEFAKLNKEKKVKVNTIMINSTENKELENVLRTIAEENGGMFKLVRESDLTNR